MEDYESSFQKYMNSLGEKDISTLRFFDRQDFYNVFDEDAELLAKCYFKSLEVIKHFKKGSTAYINISKAIAEGVFKYLLITNKFKVEIYSSSNRRFEDGGWSLQYTVSPGNLEKYQDILFGSADVSTTNTLLSLNVERSGEDLRVFLAFCDIDNGVFMVGNFLECAMEDGMQPLANLTSALFQLPCRECLLPAKDPRPEMAAVAKTVRLAGLLVSEVPTEKKPAGNTVSSVGRLVSQPEAVVTKVADEEGRGSLRCLEVAIRYLGLDTDESLRGFFDLQSFKLDGFLRLSAESSRALHVMPLSSSSRGDRESLFGLLNVCRTGLGERLLLKWVKQPLLDLNLIEHRLDLVNALVTDGTLRQSLHDGLLRRVPDLQRLARRLLRAAASLQDLHRVHLVLGLVIEVTSALEAAIDGPHKPALQAEFATDLEEVCLSTAPLREMVERTLDLDAIASHEYRIRADVDDGLRGLRDQMDALEPQMQTEYSKVCDLLPGLPRKALKLETSSTLGYYVRVSRKDEKMIRDERSVFVVETLKDGVKFQSKKMQGLSESYLKLRSEYEESQKAVIDEIMKIARGYVPQLNKLSNILAKLDVLCSLAVTVVTAPAKYVRPKLLPMEGRKINLKNCRHPLIEGQANVSYIANDVSFDDEHRFHIITGPNMGGKSTYLRSVGLCVIMAQIGSFVPCDEAEMSLCDRVMTRIGSGDCQVKGVSTFMAEMLDISWILKTATRHSLIVIDELGRGTSTFDGCGLAWSISEHLIKETCAFTLFATHFHELTRLPEIHEGAVNLHVAAEADGEGLVFLYRVRAGAASRSYGVEVGRLAGLPESVLKAAAEALSDYEEDNLRQMEHEEMRVALRDFCAVDLSGWDEGAVPEMLYTAFGI